MKDASHELYLAITQHLSVLKIPFTDNEKKSPRLKYRDSSATELTSDEFEGQEHRIDLRVSADSLLKSRCAAARVINKLDGTDFTLPGFRLVEIRVTKTRSTDILGTGYATSHIDIIARTALDEIGDVG